MTDWVSSLVEELLQRQEDQVPGRLHAVARSVRVDDVDEHHHLGSLRVSLADALVELQELTERLRRECPWDREQTARTIVPHTVEEAYEVADAALAGDDAKLLDEIGDLLFQSYFLALLLAGARRGRPRAGARGVHAKLVRAAPARLRRRRGRRPPARVREQLGGDQARATRAARASSTTCPRALPALLYARKVQLRARVGRLRVPGSRRRARRLRRRAARAARRAAATRPADRDEPDRARRRRARRRALRGGQRRAAAERRPGARAARGGEALPRAGRDGACELAAADGKDWTTLPLDEQDAYYDEAKERRR